MADNMALAYALARRAKKMAQGGMVRDEMASGYGEMPCPECETGYCEVHMAHGGMAGGETPELDMIGRIMAKRMSKGGEVANETEPMADDESADFDELVKDDDLEADSTGSDEIGDGDGDDDDQDLVSKIMRSRVKKAPRTA